MFPPRGRSALAKTQDVGSDFVRLGRRAAGVFHVHVRALNENGKGLRGGAGAIGDDRRRPGHRSSRACRWARRHGTRHNIVARVSVRRWPWGAGREDSVWRDGQTGGGDQVDTVARRPGILGVKRCMSWPPPR